MVKIELFYARRLFTNKSENEFNWDCRRLFSHSFCSHLKWQIEKFPEKFPDLTRYLREHEISTIEHNLIPELVNDGKLTMDLPNLYRVS
jgi:hypothetical protein